MEEIKAEGQQIIFSGVGAHHMNGVAERSTRTTTTKSQTMMLHSMLRWPDQTDIKLWPFAMNHATCLNNIMSRRTLAHCLAWSCDSQQTSNNSSHSTADCNCSCHTHSLQHCTSMMSDMQFLRCRELHLEVDTWQVEREMNSESAGAAALAVEMKVKTNIKSPQTLIMS